jgi:hypothetical protein
MPVKTCIGGAGEWNGRRSLANTLLEIGRPDAHITRIAVVAIFPSHSDELGAPPHSITSSASNCSELGTGRPRAAAVLRLMTSSYLSGS